MESNLNQKEQRIAILHIPGEEPIELPILSGTEGKDVIDIKNLSAKGYFTYDPGLLATASCQSKITFINGEKGILLHRGYPIAELAMQTSYLELCYLLLYKELPNQDQLSEFKNKISHNTMVHEQIPKLFQAFRRDAHPMAIMCGIAGALSAFYHEQINVSNPKDRELVAIRLLAKIPTLAAMAYKYSEGQPFMYPQNNLSYAGNFLHMMFATPCEPYVVNPILEKAMDRIFILHADHEQNASTSSVRFAGSTGANPYACIAAGIAALWGPAHGGANEACLRMLKTIGSVERIPEFIARAKDKNDPFRLMGFGHRVYKNYDPRAAVMKETCHEVLKELNIQDHKLLDVAMELEKIALQDPYFIERKLYPNVDFYSGITLSAIGIPPQMFTVIFAVARTIGWITHWCEMQQDPSSKIVRPRQLYTGVPTRHVVPMYRR